MNVFESYVNALMAMPRKPEFIGYSMPTQELYELCLAELNKLAGRDMSGHCYHDCSEEDNQFSFYIHDEGSLEDDGLSEEEIEDIKERLPFELDEHWDVTETLLDKAINAPTWIYAQVRHHDSDTVEIQIGVPSNL